MSPKDRMSDLQDKMRLGHEVLYKCTACGALLERIYQGVEYREYCAVVNHMATLVFKKLI